MFTFFPLVSHLSVLYVTVFVLNGGMILVEISLKTSCETLVFQTCQTNLYIYIKKKKWNDMFYLMTHSTHFLNLWLYGIGHMVKDNSGSKREKPAATTTWATLSNYQQRSFYMHHYPTDWIAHTKPFVTPDVEHWLEWEIAQWINHERLI